MASPRAKLASGITEKRSALDRLALIARIACHRSPRSARSSNCSRCVQRIARHRSPLIAAIADLFPQCTTPDVRRRASPHWCEPSWGRRPTCPTRSAHRRPTAVGSLETLAKPVPVDRPRACSPAMQARTCWWLIALTSTACSEASVRSPAASSLHPCAGQALSVRRRRTATRRRGRRFGADFAGRLAVRRPARMRSPVRTIDLRMTGASSELTLGLVFGSGCHCHRRPCASVQRRPRPVPPRGR